MQWLFGLSDELSGEWLAGIISEEKDQTVSTGNIALIMGEQMAGTRMQVPAICSPMINDLQIVQQPSGGTLADGGPSIVALPVGDGPLVHEHLHYDYKGRCG